VSVQETKDFVDEKRIRESPYVSKEDLDEFTNLLGRVQQFHDILEGDMNRERGMPSSVRNYHKENYLKLYLEKWERLGL